MPICMWPSTQPGKASLFLASKTCLACSAGMSGASRANFPSLIAISRQSTDVLFGRTTWAFLTTVSNCLSMPVDPQFVHIGGGLSGARRRSRFIAFAERDHFRRADHLVESVEVVHAIAERPCAALRGERGVEVVGSARQGADDAARKDDERETERLEVRCIEQRRFAALHHVRHQRPTFQTRRDSFQLG